MGLLDGAISSVDMSTAYLVIFPLGYYWTVTGTSTATGSLRYNPVVTCNAGFQFPPHKSGITLSVSSSQPPKIFNLVDKN